MFKKEDELILKNDEVETIIGPSVKVEGDFVAVGDVVVEGMVSGSMKTEQNLKVGENAKIFANVSANSAKVAGEIQGNLKIKNGLELSGTAKIYGDIKSKTLNVTTGAIIIGKCAIGEDKRSKPEKIDRKKDNDSEELKK